MHVSERKSHLTLLMRSAHIHVNCPPGTAGLLFYNVSGCVANLVKSVAEVLQRPHTWAFTVTHIHGCT